MNNLLKLRKYIDICDKKLIDILSRRFFWVKKIALYKKKNSLKPLDSIRWQEVIKKITALSAKKKLSQTLVKSIMDSIHQESLTIEKEIISNKKIKNIKIKKNINKNFDIQSLILKTYEKIAFLGPLGTYSHIATEKIFNYNTFYTKKSLSPQNNIIDVFESVQKGEVAYGIVPVKNSIEGIVKDTIHPLTLYNVSIVKEYCLPIDHCLMVLNPIKNILQINKVKAHPQALGQCKRWLKNNIPNALLEPTNSNVSGISNLKTNEAIIASRINASMYNLSIVAENISDNPNNTTMFYVIKSKSKS